MNGQGSCPGYNFIVIVGLLHRHWNEHMWDLDRRDIYLYIYIYLKKHMLNNNIYIYINIDLALADIDLNESL